MSQQSKTETDVTDNIAKFQFLIDQIDRNTNLPNFQVPKNFFLYSNRNVYHSGIETLQNCSAFFFVSVSLVRENKKYTF